MGFVYSQYGLCCDFCGKSKPEFNVRKIACPYGYCQAWATCKLCFAEKKHLYASCKDMKHKEYCKYRTQESDREEQKRQSLLNAGYFLRSGALSHGDKVKVIFRNKEGVKKAFFMTHKAYDEIPLGTNATIEDYDMLSECQSLEIYDAV